MYNYEVLLCLHMMTYDPECDSCWLVLPDTQMCCPGHATPQSLVSAAGSCVLDWPPFFPSSLLICDSFFHSEKLLYSHQIIHTYKHLGIEVYFQVYTLLLRYVTQIRLNIIKNRAVASDAVKGVCSFALF